MDRSGDWCKALGSLVTWRLRPAPPDTRLGVRLQHVLPENQNLTNTNRHVVAISPDGNKFVYPANRRLYLRDLNQLDAQAYESNESGRFEVSVRPFPAVDTGRWQVSSNGAQHPLWSRDGRELFFIAADGPMMSVPLEPGPTFRHGKPVSLFSAGHYYVNVARDYDVSPDGKRFYMVKNAAGPGTRASMIVVTRWFDEVRTKVEAQK